MSGRITTAMPLGTGSILPSGQFRAIHIPLKEIIKFAFNVRDEAIVGAPGWVDAEHYDIVGKAPPVGQEETFWRSTSAVQLMRWLRFNTDRLRATQSQGAPDGD